MADKDANLIIRLKDEASRGLASIGASIVSLGGVLAGLIKFLKDSTSAFFENETAVNRLNLALKNQGIFSESTSKDLQLYAQQLQKITTFSDEAILETQTLLLTFGLAGSQLKSTTKAALDLSVGLGIDLRTATLLLGKAAVGETGTLARYGITIDENIPKAQRFEVALGQIQQRFGGSAQAELDTYSGKVKKLKDNFNEFQETVGTLVVEAFEFWRQKIAAVFEWLDKVHGITNDLLGINQTFHKAENEMLQAIIDKKTELIQKSTEEGTFQSEETQRRLEQLDLLIAKEKEKFDQTDQKQIEEQQKTRTHLDFLARIEKENADERAKKRKAFLDEQEALRRNKAAVEDKIEDDLKKKHDQRLEDRKTIFGTVTEQIRGIASGHAKAAFAVEKAHAISTAIINTAAGAAASLRYGIPLGPIFAGIISALGAAQVGVIASQTVAGLAEGGLVLPTPGGTMARIGEAGSPEAVIPLDDERASEMIGGTTININVGTLVADELSVREFARRIDEELFALNRNRQSVALG